MQRADARPKPRKSARWRKTASVAAEVQQDVDLGINNRIGSTPTMFVTHNGKTYAFGEVSYSSVEPLSGQPPLERCCESAP